MELRIKTGHKLNDISIISPYATYMEYGEIDLNKYWRDLNNTMEDIPKIILIYG